MSFQKLTADATGMTLAANGDISDSTSGAASVVTGNLEAGGAINLVNTTHTGTKKSGASVTKRDLPKASVFDPYIAAGTAIPYTSLPAYSGGGRAIQGATIAPTVNPYNFLAPNALGVYVIDCANQKITVLNSRIVGTLVLLNPGTGSGIGADGVNDNLNWVPAVTNYPCLLVKGNIKIAFGALANAALTETALTNFNLTVPYPYPSGTTNLQSSDAFPSRIQGLVYVSGNVTGSQSGGGTFPRVDSLIIGGNYTPSQDTIYPVYTSMYMSYPPPGFTGCGTPKPQSGTWRRETMP